MKSVEFLLCPERLWLVALGWGRFVTFYGRIVSAKRVGILPMTHLPEPVRIEREGISEKKKKKKKKQKHVLHD